MLFPLTFNRLALAEAILCNLFAFRKIFLLLGSREVAK